MEFQNNQILVEHIPSIQTIHFTGLKPQYRWIDIFWNSLFFLFVIIIGSGIVLQYREIPNDLLIYIIPTMVFLWVLSVLLTFKTFPHKGYALRQRDIIYKKGWLFKTTTMVPFNRVQHCEVTQGPMGALLNVAKLKIFTAGGSQSDLTIPGITKHRANELKQFIIQKTMDEEE